MSIKISELPVASSVNSADIVPIVQDGTTKQAQAEMLKPQIETVINSSSTNDKPVGAKAVYDYSAPIKHDSETQEYGVATTTKYGHTKIIDSLDRSSYQVGESLSAYQGAVLKQSIDNINDDIESITDELATKQTISNMTNTLDENSTNTQYPNAQVTFEKYNELLNQIPTATATGNPINVQDSSNLPIVDFAMSGNATQRTFTILDYIESTGTQYIDTGITPNATIDIEAKYLMDYTQTSKNTVFGTYSTPSSTVSRCQFAHRTNYLLGFGDSSNDTISSVQTAEPHIVKLQQGTFSVDDTVVTTLSSTNFNSPKNIYLLASNSNGTASGQSNGKLYYVKIKKDNVLVRNLIPAKDSNDVVCLYDTVTQEFFYNKGTGTFTAGSTVGTAPNPDYPQDIHVVTGDNTVVVNGKNLLPISSLASTTSNGITFTNNNDGSYTFNGTSSGYTSFNLFTNLSFNGNYTYVMRDTATSGFVMYLQSNSGQGIGQATTHTTIDNAIGKMIIGINNGVSLNNVTIKPYVYKGNYDSSTTYEPFTSQTQLISLGDIELAKIGTYTDRIFKDSGKWYVEKKIGKYILNGGIIEIDLNSSTQVGGRKIIGASLGGLNTVDSVKTNRTEQVSNGDRLLVTGGGGLYIRLLKANVSADLTTVDKMNSWLSENNIICYYVLNSTKVTYTEITDTTLIGQLENILAMHTNKNVTNISIVPTGTNAEPTGEWEYRVDLGTVIGNINNAIISLGGNV